MQIGYEVLRLGYKEMQNFKRDRRQQKIEPNYYSVSLVHGTEK